MYKWLDGACTFLLVPGLSDEKGESQEDQGEGAGGEYQQARQASPRRDRGGGEYDMLNAQHEDGYINSYYTVRGIGQRWTNLRDMHELYCLGHLD